MTTWIALLRGVNVGGNNKLPMAELKKLLAKNGFENVRTYIASGNVVFESAEKDGARLAQKIEDVIEKKFGFRPATVMRTREEMVAVAENNPFANRDLNPALLAVIFLPSDPGKAAHAALAKIGGVPEEIKSKGREIYIYYPNGQGRPTLKFRDVENAIGKVATTARNLNTVVKLGSL